MAKRRDGRESQTIFATTVNSQLWVPRLHGLSATDRDPWLVKVDFGTHAFCLTQIQHECLGLPARSLVETYLNYVSRWIPFNLQ